MNNIIRLLTVWLTFTGMVLGQQEKPEDPNAEWRTFCDLTAANITIRQPGSLFNEKGETFISRHENAIFEHRNPFNRTEHGLVYLWKQKSGRPVAIFTCLVIQVGENAWNEIIEYHSLHDDRLVTSFGSSSIANTQGYRSAHNWKPKRGIDWVALPDAPKPAKSPRLLQLQGRNLVRRFRCDGYFGRQKYSLRAQTKPVYTYDAMKDGKQVGGLLTFFCRATDPEAILLLEVQENDDGELAWHYAFGNFTRGTIKFSLDKEEVWSKNTSGRAWFEQSDVHYGNFPIQNFTIEDGIARQQAHLDRAKKKR